MNEEFAVIGAEALAAQLEAGTATVLTPNRRLAQSLQREFDCRQPASCASWSTPDILPFDAFVRRLWDEALYGLPAGEVPLLLAPAQEQALWEEAIAGSRLGGALASPAAAASQCRRAWALAQAWGLAGDLPRHEGGEDSRAFNEWAARYVRATRERGMTDEARLANVVVPLLASPAVRKSARLVLYGFDLVTPQQRALVAALEAHGCEAGVSQATPREGRAARRAFATIQEEWSEIACWARARLEADPAARIGIVVPDLAQSRERVSRALARVLRPSYLTDGGPVPFDLSLGVGLDHYPLVADALAILRLCGREVAFEEASRIVRSPFIAGGQSEAPARARADAAMRGRAGLEVSLEVMVRLAASGGSSPRILLDRLSELADFRRARLFGARPAGEWAEAFFQALRVVGFPGDRTLDSAEMQLLDKWHDLLGDFAALERVTGRMKHAEACARLERMARETLFQPESREVPVRVLGILESAGLTFDHLWISGLSDEAWPLPARPNPFLPVALQRRAGIPHADAQSALELDRRLTAGWLRAAGEVVVSHARAQQESELAASPLVAHVPLVTREALAIPRFGTLRESLQGRGTLERLPDTHGSELGEVTRTGGTGLFKDQAACPFRAYARHRLGARELEAPQPGLAAHERGTLLHEMLRATWQAVGSRDRLLALAPAEKSAILEAAAAEALAVLRRRRAEVLSGRFARMEQRRLVAIAGDWLALEAKRPGFEVVAVERKTPVTFGGVTVEARIDREDRLAEGGRVIIDYKTGKAKATAASWIGPRPDDPQLPMYALASGDDVRGLAFAQVLPGSLQFCGVAMEEGLLPRVGTVDKVRAKVPVPRDWGALTAMWRRDVEALAREFRAGDARVSPKDGAKTCELCAQKPFCRVAAGERAAEEEGVE
jgi:ATP-dependent helicase/nuclease subunit B